MEELENAEVPAPVEIERSYERRDLAAVSAFLDRVGAGSMDAAALRDWFEHHLVRRGLMPRTSVVREPPSGAVSIGAGAPADGSRLAQLLGIARRRVLDTLRAFTTPTQDDRFLNAAIFPGRVVRVARGARSGPVWEPRPRVLDRLSDVVLALMAVDVLTRREEYDRAFAICDTCGRISFDARLQNRRGCADHGLG